MTSRARPPDPSYPRTTNTGMGPIRAPTSNGHTSNANAPSTTTTSPDSIRAIKKKANRRIEELGFDEAWAETSSELQAQSFYLYDDRIWNKRTHVPADGMSGPYWMEIYRFWRDIGYASEHRQYDRLWEYVASRDLPRKRLTAAHERKLWK